MERSCGADIRSRCSHARQVRTHQARAKAVARPVTRTPIGVLSSAYGIRQPYSSEKVAVALTELAGELTHSDDTIGFVNLIGARAQVRHLGANCKIAAVAFEHFYNGGLDDRRIVVLDLHFAICEIPARMAE